MGEFIDFAPLPEYLGNYLFLRRAPARLFSMRSGNSS
jgi:hypothetical protein